MHHLCLALLALALQSASFATSPVAKGPTIFTCLDFNPVDTTFTSESKGIFNEMVGYLAKYSKFISTITISTDNDLRGARNYDTEALTHWESLYLTLGRQRYIVDQFYRIGELGKSVLHDHAVGLRANDMIIAPALPKCVASVIAETTADFCSAGSCPSKIMCGVDGCAPPTR